MGLGWGMDSSDVDMDALLEDETISSTAGLVRTP
jgi:hypothetical protein